MEYLLIANETAEDFARRDRTGLLGRLVELHRRTCPKWRDAQRRRAPATPCCDHRAHP